MDYELDFDTSLLDYHASKVDDLPYLDLFHDDKLDFGEDRQDCADLADAASPNDVIGGILDSVSGGLEFEDDLESNQQTIAASDADQSETLAASVTPITPEAPVQPVKEDDSKSKKRKSSRIASNNEKMEKQKAADELNGVTEATEAKRPRRSSRQYNLRQTSIINRIETEVRRAKPKEPKPKSKPPPLSKYRRRTANSRERTRMAEINDAFEVLRKAIPNFPTDESSKLTKITTLRLALNYIGALRDMLGYPDAGVASDSSPPIAESASPTTTTPTVSASVSSCLSTSKSSTCPSSAESKPSPPQNCKSVSESYSPNVTLTKDSVSALSSADPALASVNTVPFTDFNLAAITFSTTVPSPGSSTTIPSPDNLSCINTNMNCFSPGTMNCLSPDSMNCVSPSLSLTCSSPGSSISDSAAANFYNIPYMGLSHPLDSEGESVTSLS